MACTGGLGVRNEGASLGLYTARQRWFDAHLGRWLTPDPIGFSGGLNLYAYVENQPVGAVDPSGLESAPPGWDPIEFRKGRYRHAGNKCLSKGDC